MNPKSITYLEKLQKKIYFQDLKKHLFLKENLFLQLNIFSNATAISCQTIKIIILMLILMLLIYHICLLNMFAYLT